MMDNNLVANIDHIQSHQKKRNAPGKEFVFCSNIISSSLPIITIDESVFCSVMRFSPPRSSGMDESLFKRLEFHSEAVVHLNVQYRMNRSLTLSFIIIGISSNSIISYALIYGSHY